MRALIERGHVDPDVIEEVGQWLWRVTSFYCRSEG